MKKILYIIIFSMLVGGINTDGPLELARQKWQQSDYHSSIKYLKIALSQYPSMQADITYHLAQAYSMVQAYDSALTLYRQLLPYIETSRQADIYNHIGYIQIQQYHFREALLSFRQALIKNPLHPDAAFNYELLYKRVLEPESPAPPAGSSQGVPPPVSSSTQRPGRSFSSSGNSNTENDALTFYSDSLSMLEAIQVLEWVRKREYQYLQQLKKSPRTLPIDPDKPNW